MENIQTKDFGDWFITDAPHTLDEIYGQNVVVRYLKSKQKSGIFDKSTFFQGGFGSGKTALAKILAKSIACKNKNANGEPCSECPTCKAVDDETFNRDVIYMNAEDMSAQEVRDKIREVMQFPATRDAAKVVICDEAQALSKEGVEAFLQATQSPKKGYFFIFTAMDKLKGGKAGALQSRCKVFKMKMPTIDEMYQYLGKICIKKGLTKDTTIPKEFFTEGLQYIAQGSEYSFRKAISLLEQCYTGRIFTIDEMKQLLDVVSVDDAVSALVDIANGKKSKLVWDVLTGTDYNDKFALMLAIIGDASLMREFGTQYVDSDEAWKWRDKVTLAKAPYFEELKNGFMTLANKAYLTRGEWKIVCSDVLSAAQNSTTKKLAESNGHTRMSLTDYPKNSNSLNDEFNKAEFNDKFGSISIKDHSLDGVDIPEIQMHFTKEGVTVETPTQKEFNDLQKAEVIPPKTRRHKPAKVLN